MVKKISLQTLDVDSLQGEEALWVYNALDCTVTEAVWFELVKNDTPYSLLSERFVQAMQAPALEMMLRGMKVNSDKKHAVSKELEDKASRLIWLINQYSYAIADCPLNPASVQQKHKILHTVMRLPVQYKYAKGKRVPTLERGAIEKLASYPHAAPLCNALLAFADINKKLGTLKAKVDADKRMRCSFNICGTETARWSCSSSAHGTGLNMQNQQDEMREMYEADPGYKLGYADLDQAESRLVAYASGDENYITACESGDLHSTVCRMVWEDLPWDTAPDRVIANRPFYRHFSYRDMAKRGGHGTNYLGKPPTIAKHLNVEPAIVEKFQRKYFKAFPGIQDEHRKKAAELQLTGSITTVLGRKRFFFNRHSDEATIREAVAFEPQSSVGEILNLALYKVWRASHFGELKGVQILLQVHDAILFQYPEEQEATLLPKVLKLMEIPVKIKGRTMVIPTSVEIGWNWRHKKESNPYGLEQYTGSDERKKPASEATRFLARHLDAVHK